MTHCVLIGNSDDKLGQAEWSGYVTAVDGLLSKYEKDRHFFGGPPTHAPWQNACWVVELEFQEIEIVKHKLCVIASRYRQDSVAVINGITEFIGGTNELR